MTDEPTTAAGRALFEGERIDWHTVPVHLHEVLAIEAEARREGAAEALAALPTETSEPLADWLRVHAKRSGWHSTGCSACVLLALLAAIEAERKKAAETARWRS